MRRRGQSISITLVMATGVGMLLWLEGVVQDRTYDAERRVILKSQYSDFETGTIMGEVE